jgi:hypothetical protein
MVFRAADRTRRLPRGHAVRAQLRAVGRQRPGRWSPPSALIVADAAFNIVYQRLGI